VPTYHYSRQNEDIDRRIRDVDLVPLAVNCAVELFIDFDHDLTSDERAALDQAMLDAGYAFAGVDNSGESGLEQTKRAKYLAIDTRTEELIDQGFSFAGKVFSLSSNAQKYWIGMMVGKDLLTYPLVVNTLDDSSTLSVTDAVMVLQMYGTAMGTVKAHLASGTALKDLVRAATTIPEVQAIVDSR
jgi:hypothetical protein